MKSSNQGTREVRSGALSKEGGKGASISIDRANEEGRKARFSGS